MFKSHEEIKLFLFINFHKQKLITLIFEIFNTLRTLMFILSQISFNRQFKFVEDVFQNFTYLHRTQEILQNINDYCLIIINY